MQLSQIKISKLLVIFLLFIFTSAQPCNAQEMDILDFLPAILAGAVLNKDIILDEQNRVNKLITPEYGGVLVATGSDGTLFSLEIPPNAFPEVQEITITPIADIPDLPFSEGLLWGVHFTPEGLDLLAGATLTITPSSIPTSEAMIPAAYSANGQDLHLYPMLISGNDLLFPVSHFSGVLVGTGNDANVQDLLDYWGGSENVEIQYTQDLANLLLELRELGAQLDNLTPEQKLALWSKFRDLYYGFVLPKLLLAIDSGNSQCGNFEPIYAAFRAWASWRKPIEILSAGDYTGGDGLLSLNELNSDWSNRAQSGFLNILLGCSQECANIESFCEKTPRTQKLVNLLKYLAISFGEISEDLRDDLCGGHLLNLASSIEVTPKQALLDIDDSVTVTVKVQTHKGDISSPREGVHEISWSPSNSIVDVYIPEGIPPQSATVTGIAEGSTEVTATLRECEGEEQFEGQAQIIVGPTADWVGSLNMVYSGCSPDNSSIPVGDRNYCMEKGYKFSYEVNLDFFINIDENVTTPSESEPNVTGTGGVTILNVSCSDGPIFFNAPVVGCDPSATQYDCVGFQTFPFEASIVGIMKEDAFGTPYDLWVLFNHPSSSFYNKYISFDFGYRFFCNGVDQGFPQLIEDPMWWNPGIVAEWDPNFFDFAGFRVDLSGKNSISESGDCSSYRQNSLSFLDCFYNLSMTKVLGE